MVLDTSWLNTQQYKVRIKGKVEQSRERSSAPLHLSVVAIEKGACWSPSTTVANFTFTYRNICEYHADQHYYYHQQQHEDVASAQIPLALSVHPFLSTITLRKSSTLPPVSAPSSWKEVFASESTLVCPYVGVYRKTSHEITLFILLG